MRNSSFILKKLMVRVLPGLELTLASALRPTIRFMSDDFPTFERPAKAISFTPAEGYWGGLAAEVINSAYFMII